MKYDIYKKDLLVLRYFCIVQVLFYFGCTFCIPPCDYCECRVALPDEQTDYEVYSFVKFLQSHPVSNPSIASAIDALLAAVPKAQSDCSRPVYHFRPLAQWMNDMNGPIYYGGYYHIFYQHNPYADTQFDGGLHWGHARSTDLVHWQHLPMALWPSGEQGEAHCFSGCSILNGAGQPMIFYTSITGPTPQLRAAYSLDGELVTWAKHSANPILTDSGNPDIQETTWRDPFIFKTTSGYYMLTTAYLKESVPNPHGVVLIHKALNDSLSSWEYKGVFFDHPDPAETIVECPVLLELNGKWVLILSLFNKAHYFVGEFDEPNLKFVSESDERMAYGNYYAPNFIKDSQDRIVMTAWANGFALDKGWAGCQTLPRVVSLDSNNKLLQSPLPELAMLRGNSHSLTDITLANSSHAVHEIEGDTIEIIAELTNYNATVFGVKFRRISDGFTTHNISYNGSVLNLNGTTVPLVIASGQPIKLHVFLDRAITEVFVNDGEQSLCSIVYPNSNELYPEVYADGGGTKIESLEIWQMNSMWDR